MNWQFNWFINMQQHDSSLALDVLIDALIYELDYEIHN